jgi:sialic acid synthase SpsE
MAEAVRDAQRALGEACYEASAREQASRALRRSLYVVKDVKAGELFTAENVRSIRPALGLEPKHLPSVLGKRASRDVRRGEPVSWELLS